MTKTKQTNYEGFVLHLERENIKKRRKIFLENEFFLTVKKLYEEPLGVYDDTVKKNIFGLEFSDRELIAIMFVHSLQQKKLDESYLKSRKIPNAIEFYEQLRDTAKEQPTGKRDLIYVVGENILRKYTFEEIQEKYYWQKI